MNEDGTLKEVQVDGKKYKGKALYDILEHNVAPRICKPRSEKTGAGPQYAVVSVDRAEFPAVRPRQDDNI